MNNTFKTDRFFPFPAKPVFGAFADPEKLRRWWGPNGFTNDFHSFDFKPGGKWAFTMVGPDGARYLNECEFQEIAPDTKLVIRHSVPPFFTLTVTLQAEGAGTRLHFTQAFDDPRVAHAVRHIVEPANEQNLDRLTEVLLSGA